MQPLLEQEVWVFSTISKEKLDSLKLNPLMVFQEKEGITIIIGKKEADLIKLSYNSQWALITLNVQSDLQAVGFLAKITAELAKKNISVNAVSAYYHDHLFVPVEKADEALEILRKLSAKS